MSVESAPYYWVRCDNCGARCEYDGEYATWPTLDQAISVAMESEWTTNGVRHHCPNCPDFCEQCGATQPDAIGGEREYLCPACWAEAEASDAAGESVPA